MNDAQKFLKDLFSAYNTTYQAKDDRKIGIVAEKERFEKLLDEMWNNYTRGNMKQVVEYKAQVKYIKEAGLVVKRSKSTGKHKILLEEV